MKKKHLLKISGVILLAAMISGCNNTENTTKQEVNDTNHQGGAITLPTNTDDSKNTNNTTPQTDSNGQATPQGTNESQAKDSQMIPETQLKYEGNEYEVTLTRTNLWIKADKTIMGLNASTIKSRTFDKSEAYAGITAENVDTSMTARNYIDKIDQKINEANTQSNKNVVALDSMITHTVLNDRDFLKYDVTITKGEEATKQSYFVTIINNQALILMLSCNKDYTMEQQEGLSALKSLRITEK